MQRRLLVIIISLILLYFPAFSQEINEDLGIKWAISIAYGKSKARLPSGYGIVYPGPPAWAGDLKVTEETENSLSFDLFREFNLKNKNILLDNSLGFALLGYVTHYSYDYENSFNNIVRSERSFQYLSISQRIKYKIQLNNSISLIPAGGIFIGYLLKSDGRFTNYIQGNFRTSYSDLTGYEKRWNYGYEGGLAIRFNTSKVIFDVTPFYREYHKSHFSEHNKRIFLLGMGLSVFLPKKSHQEENK